MINLVIGASENPARYSNKAIKRLREHRYEVRAIGKREGEVDDVKIQTGLPDLEDVDTVLFYINPNHQDEYYDYVKNLKPRRILFAPGTENPDFEKDLQKVGIEPIEACSLVMLSTGQY